MAEVKTTKQAEETKSVFLPRASETELFERVNALKAESK